MQMPKQEISLELYHRIYRLLRKGADTMRIAAAVELPLKTVQNIVARFNDSNGIDSPGEGSAVVKKAGHTKALPCDAIVFSKGRYALVDITGHMVDRSLIGVMTEFEKLLNTDYKAFALKMKGVSDIDQDGLKALIDFYNQCTARRQYTAILDPSEVVEAVLKGHQPELDIPIFGTESTFEKNAFAIKTGMKFKK